MIQGLYAITNAALMPGAQLLKKTESALAGGCRLVQYRNKTGDKSLKYREARALQELCGSYGAMLIINDSVELAEAVQAGGVHLGQDDSSVESARKRLGPDAVIGATCHASLELAERACGQGASYLAFGRFFPSSTKPLAPPAHPDVLARVGLQLRLPTVAIGGINMDNAAFLIRAGADALAVSQDLFAGDDLAEIRRRTARYVSLFDTVQEPR